VLSSELEICLNEAFQGAREARHEFMTVEHLLLAIIDTPKVMTEGNWKVGVYIDEDASDDWYYTDSAHANTLALENEAISTVAHRWGTASHCANCCAVAGP